MVPGDWLLPVLSFLDPSYFRAGESIKEVQILTEYFHISQFKSKPEVEEDISSHFTHPKTQFILTEQCFSKCSSPHSEGIVIFQDHRHRIDNVKNVFSYLEVYMCKDNRYVEGLSYKKKPRLTLVHKREQSCCYALIPSLVTARFVING